MARRSIVLLVALVLGGVGALVLLASVRPPEEYAFTGFATVWLAGLPLRGQHYVHALRTDRVRKLS